MKKEVSLIDAAATLLSTEKHPIDLYELYDKITSELELSESEKEANLIKFYTDLTVSAKFAYVGDNKWNLKINEKIELWEKDGSFYKEYNVVELPEEYKVEPYVNVKKAKVKKETPVVEQKLTKKEEVAQTDIFNLPEEPVEKQTEEPIVEPIDDTHNIMESEPVVDVVEEFEEEFEEDYDDFDEEKYNEYMDTYEDQYED
jgi:DNA-directed RNA polymerase subunit delta